MPPSCDDVLHKCDAALKARDKQVTLADLALQQSQEQNNLLHKEVEANDRFYRQPAFLLAVGGVAALLLKGILTK